MLYSYFNATWIVYKRLHFAVGWPSFLTAVISSLTPACSRSGSQISMQLCSGHPSHNCFCYLGQVDSRSQYKAAQSSHVSLCVLWVYSCTQRLTDSIIQKDVLGKHLVWGFSHLQCVDLMPPSLVLVPCQIAAVIFTAPSMERLLDTCPRVCSDMDVSTRQAITSVWCIFFLCLKHTNCF